MTQATQTPDKPQVRRRNTNARRWGRLKGFDRMAGGTNPGPGHAGRARIEGTSCLSVRTSIGIGTLLLFLQIALVGSLILLPQTALAADHNLSFRNLGHGVGLGEWPSIGAYGVSDGGCGYCLDQTLVGPGYTDGNGSYVPWHPYTYSGTASHDYAYIALNGYPRTTNILGIQLSDEQARAATQLALWMINGTTRLDGVRVSDGLDFSIWAGGRAVVDAAAALHNAAKADTSDLSGSGILVYTTDFLGVIGPMPRQPMLYVPQQVVVNFTKTSANATITSGNSEYSYAGATYEIRRESNDELLGTIVTDEDGRASCLLPPNERLYAVETQAPPGFVLSSERTYFQTGNGNGEVTLADQPASVRLHVQKRDSATGGESQSGASLEGAEFLVTSQSTQGWQARVTTNATGYALVGNIPLGKITVAETKAPEGYRIDDVPRTLEVRTGQLGGTAVFDLEPEGEFPEHPIAFDLEIAKTKGGENGWDESDGKGTPAAGVRFEVVSNTTGTVVGTLITNEAGFASSDDTSTVDEAHTAEDKTSDPTKPWFGNGKRGPEISGAIPYDAGGYTVREVPETVPEGFDRVEEWTITAQQMVDGARLQYSAIDKTLNTRLRLVKVDEESGQTVALAGFSFCIYDAEGNRVSMTDWHPSETTVDEFTTDDQGMVTLPERMAPGDYTIRETSVQPPYLLPEDGVTFTVSGDYATAEPLTIVRIANRQAKGRARLVKRCAASDSGNIDGGCSLAGAEFDVVTQEDVISPDGTIHAAKGQVVDHVTTDEQGHAQTTELYLGSGEATYAFVETVPPAGHVLDATPHEFTLSYANETTPVVETKATVEDKPTEVTLDKLILGSDDPLAGASFAIWSVADEIDVKPSEQGMGAIAVRMDSDTRGHVRVVEDLARQSEGDAPDDETTLANGNSASRQDQNAADGNGSDESGGSSDEEPKSTAPKPAAFELTYDETKDAYVADNLSAGTYWLEIDGESAGALDIPVDGTTWGTVVNGAFSSAPTLLNPGTDLLQVATDDEGTIAMRHLRQGRYRMREVSAPDGYLTDGITHEFSIDASGLAEGEKSHSVTVADDFTKVDISKRDITNEQEIPGARLTVADERDNVIETWTSGEDEHRINALPPGTYTLTEEMTPQSYDQATTVTFVVEETGAVQKVVMHDEPISITGQIDKRQEIADPTRELTDANGDGENRASTTVSADGAYSYSLDFRSTSSTWTDEFTVTDTLSGAAEGLAILDAVTTPQAYQDYDGLLNVWYVTNKGGTSLQESPDANATLQDGHENPWLHDSATSSLLGDDGRALDYSGWRLWRADVSATQAQTLEVADLGLGEGEVVTAVRFEFGRVEKGFTTRTSSWERDDLKHDHDDLDAIETAHEGTFEVNGTDVAYAPAIMRLHVTDAYAEGTTLANAAHVDLFRNGGGDGLEDHDDDRVAQTPRSTVVPLDQTGTAVRALLAFAAGLGLVGLLLAARRALPGRGRR